MKILWISPRFLHPTVGGGLIRTLGILRCLSERHEIHFAAFVSPAHPEGPDRASEYSFRAYPFPRPVSRKRLFSRLPEVAPWFHSPELKRFLEGLLLQERFDCVVADFLFMAASCPRLEQAAIFEHNVETTIFERQFEHAQGFLSRWRARREARRMFVYERAACRAAGSVIAVSTRDAARIESMFGLERVAVVPTGVDAGYFAPPSASPHIADLVFVGVMDVLANADGVGWFVERILPRIRSRRPQSTLAVVGRAPSPEIRAWAEREAGVSVTGLVPDVRPYLWGASVAVVPLRIGGGTRIKIYEAMAAGVPVVSTAVGAEGLELNPGVDISIADDPAEFAERCLELLDGPERRAKRAAAGRRLVAEKFSWEQAARAMEQALLGARKSRT